MYNIEYRFYVQFPWRMAAWLQRREMAASAGGTFCRASFLGDARHDRMNVIVFSKRLGRARQFELGRPVAATLTIAPHRVRSRRRALRRGAARTQQPLRTHLPRSPIGAAGWKISACKCLDAKQELQNRLDALARSRRPDECPRDPPGRAGSPPHRDGAPRQGRVRFRQRARRGRTRRAGRRRTGRVA